MRADLPRIHRQQYWVGPKTDGVRALLVCSFVATRGTEDELEYCVLVDRTGRMAMLPADVIAPEPAYSGTLVDGELTWDGRDETPLTFTAFDVVAVNGYSMRHHAHSIRQVHLKRFIHSVFVPRKSRLVLAAKQWVRLQDGDDTTTTADADMLTALATSATSDGLILAPENGAPLRAGRQRDHFKWKVAHHHTVDMVCDGTTTWWLESAGVRVLASDALGVELRMGESSSLPVGHTTDTVVECALTLLTEDGRASVVRPPHAAVWLVHPVRLRPDKLHANDATVARATLQNIRESILIHELL